MSSSSNLNRYSIIKEKNPRQIALLVGSGCKWKRCRFCDYHLDYDICEDKCYEINKSVLYSVTDVYSKLEIINSGSFTELDNKTLDLIESLCVKNSIKELHFECHYLYRHKIPKLRQRFAKKDIVLKLKCGVETFDATFRQDILDKGMKNATPQDIADYFDEVCLLFGLNGQDEQSMRNDIRIGLQYFERICINIMQENTTDVKPDYEVIRIFIQNIYPDIKDDVRVDILLENTDFGVGGVL